MYLDVRGVELEIDEDPDEEDPEFRKTPVFETCQSLRRQVRAVLCRDGMTKAALARACGDQTAGRLTRFLTQKGVMNQNTNPFFYNAYLLLEKIRIGRGGPSPSSERPWRRFTATGGASTSGRMAMGHIS